MKLRNVTTTTLLLLTAGSLFARTDEMPREFSLDYRYQNAETHEIEKGQQQVILSELGNQTNDPRIDKAILVGKLGDLITETLTTFKTECDQSFPDEPIYPIMKTTIIPIPEPVLPCDDVTKLRLADELLAKIEQYSDQVASISSAALDVNIAEALDLLRKLAVNMKDFTGYYSPVLEYRPAAGIGNAIKSGGLSVTTGGAQDYAYFKKLIADGSVPSPENFDSKGFMSEFDLPMGDAHCDQLLCINPVYKYDSEQNKLFVAVSMNTNVVEETFVRKPLNLALVIDISGSMSANDDTEKSRLEWAKDAAIKTITELHDEDYLSVVVFDEAAEVLVPATKLSIDGEKARILDIIKNLQTKGSTNLYDGLQAGYEQVSDNAQNLANYNHRVILISDAGLNTGVTNESVNLALVTDYAAENIGLSAIGLGLNFNQDFIAGISRSLGGNYVYAHSGRDMVRYFSSFKFLVSPIAHKLKARLSFANTNAKLINAYGIPGEAISTSNEVINVQSLFLSNQGGGAILLEYLLE